MKVSWSSPSWQLRLLPGLSITGFIVLTRLLGLLQPLEWKTLDLSLKWRPAEATDPRITLLAITEEDIQTALDYPISDQALSEFLETVQSYNPRVVGLDIFRDQPVGDGYGALAQTLQSSDNVVGIHKIDPRATVPPPPSLPDRQVGFADALVDQDGFLRRSLLGAADKAGNYQFSFTIQLVSSYLANDGLSIENGIRDLETMRFGSTEIPRFQSNTGGYIRADRGGNQTLINFRAGTQPFEKITYKALMAGQVESTLIQDRLVLIGYTAESIKDFVSSAAIAGVTPSLVPGMDAQAHAVSQILSAVIDGRPFLRGMPDGIEYLLILGSGLGGMILAQWERKPALHFLVITVISGVILLVSYGLMIMSWWLPVVPVVAAFLLNAAVLYPFYQAQAQLRSQLNDRQKLINQTYNTIHNGPLQTLAKMISTWPESQPAPDALRTELHTLNRELRDIYDTMRQEILLPTGQLVLTGQQSIDLQMPLDELLREAYQITLERHREFFEPILKIVAFEPLDDQQLSIDQKRNLGRFLEEALINIQKYAHGTTRLTIDCRQKDGNNIIRVLDNGNGLKPSAPKTLGGYGTKQAETLARSLNGTFNRTHNKPKGVCCELRWPIYQPLWKRWLP
ncbi:putative transmembrane sensor domain protein [Leptolyngbya sp. PCC 7375]|nr:putative transmembrane sensor domain protein [Leptolyngbya sp. PCC 7375]